MTNTGNNNIMYPTFLVFKNITPDKSAIMKDIHYFKHGTLLKIFPQGKKDLPVPNPKLPETENHLKLQN